eukprot:6230917-Prymnesium_polylepis.1
MWQGFEKVRRPPYTRATHKHHRPPTRSSPALHPVTKHTCSAPGWEVPPQAHRGARPWDGRAMPTSPATWRGTCSRPYVGRDPRKGEGAGRNPGGRAIGP